MIEIKKVLEKPQIYKGKIVAIMACTKCNAKCEWG